MKIELDVPVPEGWKFVGYQIPKEDQGYINNENEFKIARRHFEFTHCLTFERIEPEIDVELEEAKRKFPVGSWFQHSAWGETIFKVCGHKLVEGTVRLYGGNDVLASVDMCTPFPLPVWRCCYSSPPKKSGIYFVRNEQIGFKGQSVYEGQWYDYDSTPNEWLDEGER